MTPEALALKAATGEMVKGVGGLEAAAGFCRVGKSVLSDNTSPNKPDSFAALDVIWALEPLARERSGWPHVTSLLCRRMGGVFVPEPEVPATGGDVLSLMGELSFEFGEASRAVCDSFADGKFCADDAARVARECDDVIAKAIAMRAMALTMGGNR